jgi:uncharacterized phage protein (TIGR01671 family)
MREIKFRAMTKPPKDFGDFKFKSKMVYGTGVLQDPYNTWLIDNDNTKSLAVGTVKYVVKPETIGQFTGLYDKNGKEIYENDVVKIALNRHDKPMCIRHVVWECGRWAVEVGNGDFVTLDSCPGGYISRNEVQVIGNIYENPELVEGNDATA